MPAKKRTSYLHTIVAAGALAALLSLPAHAGRKTKTVPVEDSTAPTVTVTEAKSTGDINPSSVALVDGDFELSVDAKLASLSDPVLRDQILAGDAHLVATGRDVLVAVLDAGFTRYCDVLDQRMSDLGYDFVDQDPDPYDDEESPGRAWGHGTMVATMVLSAAPRATILPLRVRDLDGYGGDQPIVDAIYYAMKVGAKVINLSVSQDIKDDTLIGLAVREARQYGVVVVASAGNDGSPFIPHDAVGAANLVVGAVDQADQIASFSNYAKWSFYNSARVVFAPGLDVEGPLLVDGVPLRCTWSGTSFSAGLVSGAVALALELHPNLETRECAKLVATTGDSVSLAGGGPKIAGRRINLLKLVTK